MSVNFSDVLSVAAHELRSPLSVLQGYLRLLQRKRDADDPETAMLVAMLAATSRLSGLGRHASDLGVWMRREPTTTTIDASALIDAIGAHATNGLTIVPCASATGRSRLRVADTPALAAAVNALVDLSFRETRQSAGAMVFHADTAASTLHIRIAAGVDPTTVTEFINGADLPSPVPFDRGGLGLSLCLASYVFDTHDAVAVATPDLAQIDVSLPISSEAA